MLQIEQDVRDIESFETGGSNALSLYLDTDPSRGAGRNLRAQLDDALREVRSSMGSELVEHELTTAVEMAMKGIEDLTPTLRSVAAFSCPAKGFLRIVPLPEPTDQSAFWGRELRLTPLLAMLDEHERTVVALVDQEHSRVFRVFMGQIEETLTQDYGKTAKHAQAGRATRKSLGAGGVGAWMGYGERNLQRGHEWHVRRHLQQVLDAMRLGGDRLLVGGVQETVHELWRLLPKRVRSRAMMIRAIELDAPPNEVLLRVLETQRQAEREEEEELIDNLLERDYVRTVFGGAAVAEAVSEERVHTLAYAQETKIPGGECAACGSLVAGSATGPCPRCGAPLEAHRDLLERLVSRVIKSGGRVEEIREPASRPLTERGGVAALLRYVPATVTEG